MLFLLSIRQRPSSPGALNGKAGPNSDVRWLSICWGFAHEAVLNPPLYGRASCRTAGFFRTGSGQIISLRLIASESVILSEARLWPCA